MNAKRATESFDKESSLSILNELELLLADNNTESLDWIDKLKGISGTDSLIEQIDSFDFKQASITIAEIKKELM